MLGAASFISVVSGSALAYAAKRLPARTETLETCAGFMLLGGLFLIGTALPVMI